MKDGKVLVPKHSAGGSRRYHTRENCRYVSDKHKPMDQEIAEDWYEKCSICESKEEDDAPVQMGGYPEGY